MLCFVTFLLPSYKNAQHRATYKKLFFRTGLRTLNVIQRHQLSTISQGKILRITEKMRITNTTQPINAKPNNTVDLEEHKVT